MKLVTNLIKQYARVPVYPVIGNHEGVPVNRFVCLFVFSDHIFDFDFVHTLTSLTISNRLID